MNRFGGDIYLGVLDDGTISGVPEKAAGDMVKNFINMVSNPDVMNPTVYLDPKTFMIEGKPVIHIRIPTSPEVHSFKKVVYDRLGNADVRVKGTHQIAEMYTRKHIFLPNAESSCMLSRKICDSICTPICGRWR